MLSVASRSKSKSSKILFNLARMRVVEIGIPRHPFLRWSILPSWPGLKITADAHLSNGNGGWTLLRESHLGAGCGSTCLLVVVGPCGAEILMLLNGKLRLLGVSGSCYLLAVQQAQTSRAAVVGVPSRLCAGVESGRVPVVVLWKQHELPNFCPQNFGQLSVHARQACAACVAARRWSALSGSSPNCFRCNCIMRCSMSPTVG